MTTITPADRARRIVKAHLAAQWGLGTQGMTDQSTVAELGGDDLDAMEIMLRLEEEFGCELPDEGLTAQTPIGDFIALVEGVRAVA